MRGGLGAVALAAMVLLAACGSGGESPDGGPDLEGPWLTSSDPVATEGLPWAADGTVHLADGETIETGGPVRAFVVAGDGVFFFPADGEDEAGETGTGSAELSFVAPGESPVGTGLELRTDSLAASPDGRYVGGIDLTSGEEDEFGTPVAVARVVDLREGEEVVTSSEGMGDPAEDDLAVLYEDSRLRLALTDDTAYVETARDGVLAHDLGSGEVTAAEDDGPFRDPLSPQSPDGAWTIVDRPDDDVVRSADGDTVAPSAGGDRLSLYGWLDDERVLGVAEAAEGGTLVTCTVPAGDCERREETTGLLVVLPSSPAAVGTLDLRQGAAAP